MSQRLADRYELGERMGTSAAAPMLATDVRTGERCVVKELTLGRVSNWKQLDLFEREAAALKQLSHDGVPRYIDSLQTDDDGPRFYLVQSYIEGTSLEERLTRGPIPEEELVGIARGALAVLQYLQSFSPPVLHRDIKPANLVRKADGEVALVDFGTVQVELQGTMGGSTIVGTSGYMAPEQLMGRAIPASDVYALGACLIHGMTGQHPNDLPMQRMKPKWRDLAKGYTSRFVDLVDRMVEPNPNDRFEDAEAVIRAFGRENTTALSRPEETFLATRPANTDIELERTAKRLTLTIPNSKSSRMPLVMGTLLLFAVLVGLWMYSMNAPGWTVAIFAVGLLFPLLIAMPKSWRRGGKGYLVLDVDRGYRIRCPGTNRKLRAGPFSDLIGPDRGYGQQSKSFYLATKDGMYEIGSKCSRAEQDWLIDEVADFIREHRGR